MKRQLYLLLVLLFFGIMSGCNRDNDISYEATGQIVGKDLALCACCGNWIIKIDGIENTYQAVEIPENMQLDLIDAAFPIPIKLNWSIDPNSACGHIIIEDIARNN